MHITPDNRLRKLIVTGDRKLVKPARADEKTASGQAFLRYTGNGES